MARVVPATFTRGPAGFVSSRTNGAFGSCVTVSASSPGLLDSHCFLLGSLKTMYFGTRLRNIGEILPCTDASTQYSVERVSALFCGLKRPVQCYQPISLQSARFESNEERNTDLSEQALYRCIFKLLCLPFYGKG